ncbi:PA domain-containing protein [Natrinema salinisoli]|uniref:PA domain-containing protein n=1 Tax=Natrinema salinisoli TaxID=2878535 RepID=UPI001CEFD44E|nr:PA domain-containing protein [Natrinema salinisoli]
MSPPESTETDQESIDFRSSTPVSRRSMLAMLGVGSFGAIPRSSSAHPSTGVSDGHDDLSERIRHDDSVRDPSRRLIERDAATSDVVSDGPFADVTKNLDVAGRGERLLPNGTTDVWALDGYAYLGTFEEPCGTGEGFGEDRLVDDLRGPGIPVFDVHNPNRPTYVGSLPSVEGSRINDVKVADMNSGAILVHSNEPCDGGPGGFEVYNVDDPTDPTHLASVQVDDANEVVRDVLGIVDVGVHNLFLFTQGKRDYVALQSEGYFGGFQIFELTDPTDPEFVSAWGAEYLCEGEFCSGDPHEEDDVDVILDVINNWLLDGVGQSQNRLLHDVTISEDGTRAYLAHWDAGLILLDISDPANPQFVSQAIDPTAGDGEVNSHQAWPSEDGSVVVETEEDFDQFALSFSIADGPNAGEYDAAEGGFTTPIAELSEQTLAGPTTYLGLACDPEGVPEASGDGEIAVVQRGQCRFDRKAQIAIDAGYDGMVVFNEPGDESLTSMGGDSRDIPGLFVGHATGLAIFDADSADDLAVGDTGASIEATAEPERWGNVRIWDYSDEENPVLASEFDTRCSADPAHESCDPRGTYSVHNTIVERDKAYFSWYSDGVLVLDISDPYDPVETARYSRSGEEFEDQNGGIQDVWGIYKEPREPWIYASDRNGGLYVLKEYGSGSKGRDRNGH